VLVIASSAAVRAGYAWADVAAALVVVGVIAVAGTGIVRRSLYTLSDATRIEASRIEAVALAVPGVMECHKVRSRGPAGDIHVDLHVLVDPSMPIAEAHEIGHQVAGAVRKALPDISDVVVHVEPDLEIHRLKSRETSS
jgi:divalent metal cation (Fe/Co/Zn/Cd) transporter